MKKQMRKWKYKQEREKLTLKFKALDLNTIPFGASMVSDLMDGEDVFYDFLDVNGDRVDDTDLVEEGMEGFCLRFHLCPATSRTAKMDMMFFPLAKKKLLDTYRLASVFVFPGMEIYRLEMELGIPRDEILDNNSGLPILPVLRTREPIRSTTVIPSSQELVFAISSLLRKTAAPCVKSTSNSLYRAWASIKKHGESKLTETVCRDVWPLPPAPQPPQGMK